jgi:hypothetical protein
VSLAPLLIGKEDFVPAIPLRSNLVEFSNKVEKRINRVALRFGPRQRGFLRRGCLWKGSVKNERLPAQIGTGSQPNHEPFTETGQYITLILSLAPETPPFRAGRRRGPSLVANVLSYNGQRCAAA